MTASFSQKWTRQGYLQLVLDPKSREVALLRTPRGNMRFERVIFGAKASQDLFDETMYRIIGDIPKYLNQRDDIHLGGRNLQEHNKTLEKVLQRATDFGISFNKEKYQYAYTELDFCGYRVTSEGLKPAEDKVRAIKGSKAPESKEAVRSFLGVTGYLSKFIPCYMLKAPLRNLTLKNTKFRWGIKGEKAFDKLKDSIKCEDMIAYFNLSQPIIVRIEASCNAEKVRDKSKECHNYKPEPFPDHKRKRKPTNLNKHKPNKRTKSTNISSLFPKRGNRNTKRTEKHKNKMTHGKTYNTSPRRINHKATKSKTNTGTTALERSCSRTFSANQQRFTFSTFYQLIGDRDRKALQSDRKVRLSDQMGYKSL